MKISVRHISNEPKLSRREQTSFRILTGILLADFPEASKKIDRIVSVLPGGVALSHAQNMRKFLGNVESAFLGREAKGRLHFEYVRLAINDYIEPLLKDSLLMDEESVAWILEPERIVHPQYAGIYARNPESSIRLWKDVDRYFRNRYRGYQRERNFVESLFLFSHGYHAKAVETVTLSLFDDASRDIFRKGTCGRIVKSVKQKEAEMLVEALFALGISV